MKRRRVANDTHMPFIIMPPYTDSSQLGSCACMTRFETSLFIVTECLIILKLSMEIG